MTPKLVIVGVLVAAAIGFVVFAALEPVKVFGITPTGLQESIKAAVSDSAQSPTELSCEEKKEGRWVCNAKSFGEIDTKTRVNVDDQGCWKLLSGFGNKFKGREGCISLWRALGTPL